MIDLTHLANTDNKTTPKWIMVIGDICERRTRKYAISHALVRPLCAQLRRRVRLERDRRPAALRVVALRRRYCNFQGTCFALLCTTVAVRTPRRCASVRVGDCRPVHGQRRHGRRSRVRLAQGVTAVYILSCDVDGGTWRPLSVVTTIKRCPLRRR